MCTTSYDTGAGSIYIYSRAPTAARAHHSWKVKVDNKEDRYHECCVCVSPSPVAALREDICNLRHVWLMQNIFSIDISPLVNSQTQVVSPCLVDDVPNEEDVVLVYS